MLLHHACLDFWTESEASGNEKKLFFSKQVPRPKDSKDFGKPCETYLTHRGGCGGRVSRYYDLPLENLHSFLETKLLESCDAKYRDFFPAMGDLVREGVELADEHHNTPCTAACCRTRPPAGTTAEEFHKAPTPAAEADVSMVLSRGALRGWEEQGAKTCAAASIAGALNTIFHCEAKPTRDEEKDGAAAQADVAVRFPPIPGAGVAGTNDQKDATKDKTRDKEVLRVLEQDVMDYYVRWAQENRRIACTAALRGSCGLIPSTRKIGNPRLLAAGHAVARSLLRGEVRGARQLQRRASGGLGAAGGGAAAAAGSDSDEDSDDGEDDGSEPSPIETVRLLGNVNCRDAIAEGGRCSPSDPEETVEAQWAMLQGAVVDGHALLLHFRNHYALVFATREWTCPMTGAIRRQILTATSKQRPHVWFCFRQLRADIVFSTVNQVMLIRRTGVPLR
ncbi:hypothetical protein T484DRAFT_1875154 [Baffinella frigidus]|nr:hypothetical protein T484DRAFT_1875154 [Cryptophyta sp. CCMP2293]